VDPPDNVVMDFAAHGVTERYWETCLGLDKSRDIVGSFCGDEVALPCEGDVGKICRLGSGLDFRVLRARPPLEWSLNTPAKSHRDRQSESVRFTSVPFKLYPGRSPVTSASTTRSPLSYIRSPTALTMTLEKVSANKVYDGVLTKYRFKVSSLSPACSLVFQLDNLYSRAPRWEG